MALLITLLARAKAILSEAIWLEHPRDLSSEFAISRKLRPDVSRPVWHTSLSLPPGERLSDSEWSTVVDDFMSRMGFSDHQYVAVRHSDTGKDHVHIVASRIGLDGSLYHGKYEALSAIQLTQELELKYGLTVTKGLLDGPAPVATPSKNEMEMSIRTGDAPPRVVLQQLVDAALSQPCSIFDFIERLETAGVGVRANVASTGKMNGFRSSMPGFPSRRAIWGNPTVGNHYRSGVLSMTKLEMVRRLSQEQTAQAVQEVRSTTEAQAALIQTLRRLEALEANLSQLPEDCRAAGNSLVDTLTRTAQATEALLTGAQDVVQEAATAANTALTSARQAAQTSATAAEKSSQSLTTSVNALRAEIKELKRISAANRRLLTRVGHVLLGVVVLVGGLILAVILMAYRLNLLHTVQN